MKGYGRDRRMAFFNAPTEARFRIYKIVEAVMPGTVQVPVVKFVFLKWTTTSASPYLLGRFPTIEEANAEFNKRLRRDNKIEPQFELIAERTYE